MMKKSTHTREYGVFLKLLIETRQKAGLTQVQLGAMLPFGQPGISKIERGERRVDLIELRHICECFDIPLEKFVSALESRLREAAR